MNKKQIFVFFYKVCDPTKKHCLDRTLQVDKTWFCDGDQDCPDGSDELLCSE